MIVIPMAGLSSRFQRAGYDRPKWMLPLADRPLFDWSLLGFSSQFATEPFLIVFREGPGVGEFVRARAEFLGIANCRFVALAEPTRGQADTVALGINHVEVSNDEPLTIFNIDTIRPGYSATVDQGDGWIECFHGEGDHWSFVRPVAGSPDRAQEVAEKERISSLCSTGMYTFRTAALFREALALEIAAPSANEWFVAPLYQRLIEKGRDIRFGVIGPDEIFFSGTPAEYEATRKIEDSVSAQFTPTPTFPSGA